MNKPPRNDPSTTFDSTIPPPRVFLAVSCRWRNRKNLTNNKAMCTSQDLGEEPHLSEKTPIPAERWERARGNGRQPPKEKEKRKRSASWLRGAYQVKWPTDRVSEWRRERREHGSLVAQYFALHHRAIGHWTVVAMQWLVLFAIRESGIQGRKSGRASLHFVNA